jgi:hypothetical protein
MITFLAIGLSRANVLPSGVALQRGCRCAWTLRECDAGDVGVARLGRFTKCPCGDDTMTAGASTTASPCFDQLTISTCAVGRSCKQYRTSFTRVETPSLSKMRKI